MLAKDKFCVSRWGRLQLSWSRQPLSQTKGMQYALPEEQVFREEREYDNQETPMDHSASFPPDTTGAAAVGSCVPTASQLDLVHLRRQ